MPSRLISEVVGDAGAVGRQVDAQVAIWPGATERLGHTVRINPHEGVQLLRDLTARVHERAVVRHRKRPASEELSNSNAVDQRRRVAHEHQSFLIKRHGPQGVTADKHNVAGRHIAREPPVQEFGVVVGLTRVHCNAVARPGRPADGKEDRLAAWEDIWRFMGLSGFPDRACIRANRTRYFSARCSPSGRRGVSLATGQPPATPLSVGTVEGKPSVRHQRQCPRHRPTPRRGPPPGSG